MLANLIEESIVQDLVIRQIVSEGREYSQMRREMDARYEAERARRSVAGFHSFKKSPEAADPESPIAEKVRRLHRTRKRELGRRGERKA